MNKNILILIGLVILLGIGIGIGNSIKTTKDPVVSPTVYPTPTIAIQINRMPETWRTEYMSGCNKEGGNFVYCECTMQYLESHFTNPQIVQMSLDYMETDNLPKPMIDAVTACLSYYNE